MAKAEGRQKGAQKKRVLVVAQHFWPENFRINDIVEGFLEAGLEVDVLCGLPNYPKGEWFEGYKYTGPRRENYKGANIYRCGEIRRKGNTNPRIFLNYVSYPVTAIFNLPRLWGKKYDAVFSYETSPVLMILPAIITAKRRRVPLITYVLDLWPDNLYPALEINSQFLRGVARSVSHWHYRRSDKLIVLSEGLKDVMTEITHGKRNVRVIPQYCEDFYATEVPDASLQEKYRGEGFKIVFTGNISPAQDLENLVAAMRILRDDGLPASAVKCIIVGDGMSRESLQKHIEEVGLSGQFDFPGSCQPTDIPRWTGIADALYAGLAKSDNLGLTVPAKIASYMASGKPMLVAADGEAARVCEESGGAVVSPAGDAEALARSIKHMLSLQSAQLGAMGRKAKKTYERLYSRDRLLAQLIETITEEGHE